MTDNKIDLGAMVSLWQSEEISPKAGYNQGQTFLVFLTHLHITDYKYLLLFETTHTHQEVKLKHKDDIFVLCFRLFH